jgi:putative heme-binding domain-containing protein
MRSGLFLLAFGVMGALLAQSSYNYTPGDIADGGRLFGINCIECHGPEGDLIAGVDLAHGKFRRATSDADLIKIIQNGISGTGMPPHTFTEFQAATVVAYLRSLGAVPRIASKGVASRGKTIFDGKGGCAGCHRVLGQGSRVGPDLTQIGALRPSAELERSIVDPNAQVLPQNRYYRAVTKDGETITGRILNYDSYTVQLIDTKQRLLSLKRAELRESGFVDDSAMPSYKDKLSADELADVVAYLTSLKGS